MDYELLYSDYIASMEEFCQLEAEYCDKQGLCSLAEEQQQSGQIDQDSARKVFNGVSMVMVVRNFIAKLVLKIKQFIFNFKKKQKEIEMLKRTADSNSINGKQITTLYIFGSGKGIAKGKVDEVIKGLGELVDQYNKDVVANTVDKAMDSIMTIQNSLKKKETISTPEQAKAAISNADFTLSEGIRYSEQLQKMCDQAKGSLNLQKANDNDKTYIAWLKFVMRTFQTAYVNATKFTYSVTMNFYKLLKQLQTKTAGKASATEEK